MNTSQYMDKQIMDLSNSQKSNDFIDLKNPKDDDHITGDVKKEEILPSYDFQPMRPIGVSPSSNIDPANLAGARVWSSVDSKINSSIRNYDSLDSVEPGKHVLEKDRNVYDEAFVSEIDRIMKSHADNLLHALDGVSARLSQLETRTRHIENSVDDLKLSIGNNQGSTDGKLRQLEVILQEVQTDVEVVKDKQEIIEAQLNISKLQIPKINNQPETQTAAHVDSLQHQQHYAAAPPASAPLQSQYPSHHHQPSPAAPTYAPQLPTYPSTNAPPPLQNHPPPTHQFPPNQIPQRDQYHSAPSQTPDTPNQQYQALPQPQMPPPPAPQQQYPTPSVPTQPQMPPPPAPQQQYPPPSLPTQPQPQYSQPPPPQPQHPLPHQPEETPYYRQPHSQPPPIGAPPSQQFYGPPPPIYEPPPPNRSGYGSSEQFSYGGPMPQYGSGSPRKSQQLAPAVAGQSGGSGYPQLPTARILPRAIPAASGTVGGGSGGGGSGSSGTGNRVPVDDVVDRVTNMGFPRDQVRAAVRKLTENGQAVDLNVVLDKLMNGGVGNNPQSAWLGR